MIISKLQGGLANQLFQWAYGKHLSIKYQTPLFFDISFYQNQGNDTNREFALNKFPDLTYNILPLNWRKSLNTGQIATIRDNFNYYALDIVSEKKYYLDGFWQSEKYFKESENEIRKELQPDADFKIRLINILPTNSNIVSMHIRRTDYFKSKGFHPIQSIEYYTKALDIIGEYDFIFVFSDDISWCEENLKFKNMIFIKGQSDIEDMLLMSMCTHNIIANSTFSWWGAWLNSNPDKIVVAPSQWFGNKVKLNTIDIIPDNWVRIESQNTYKEPLSFVSTIKHLFK